MPHSTEKKTFCDDFQVISALVYGVIALTPHVGGTGLANPEQATMSPWQGRGSSKLKLRPPPALAAPSSQPAARATLRQVPATRQSSTQPVSGSATKITVLPNCELAENDLLSPPPAQETERTEGRRTSGRSSGAGRRKD